MNYRCILFGHKPTRYFGLLYIFCSRCSKTQRMTEVGPK